MSPPLTRRLLLLSASSLALGFAARGREYGGEVPWEPRELFPPAPPGPEASFLTDAERRFLTAAVDRLIPADEWPSASELGVVEFLDRQLAGPYGRGDIYYLQPPFMDGLSTQGYQAEAPALLYRAAIEEIDAGLREATGKTFAELSPERQDAFLTALKNGEGELPSVDATTFFATLWQNTKEGYFGDPVYGGNREMIAWKMIGFPGARYDYRPWIDHDGEPVVLDPVSVAGVGNFAVEPREAE